MLKNKNTLNNLWRAEFQIWHDCLVFPVVTNIIKRVLWIVLIALMSFSGTKFYILSRCVRNGHSSGVQLGQKKKFLKFKIKTYDWSITEFGENRHWGIWQWWKQGKKVLETSFVKEFLIACFSCLSTIMFSMFLNI